MSISVPGQRIAELMARKAQYHIKADNAVVRHLQENAHRYQGALNALEVDAFRLLNDNGATSKFGVEKGLAYLRIKPQDGKKLDRIYLLKETSDQASAEQNRRIRSEVQTAINTANQVQRAHVETLRARGQQLGTPGRLRRSDSVQTQTPVPLQTPVVPRTFAAPQTPTQNRNIFANQTRTPQRAINTSDYNLGLSEDEALSAALEASKQTEGFQSAARSQRLTEYNGSGYSHPRTEAEGFLFARNESLRPEHIPNLIDLESNVAGSSAPRVTNDITPEEWAQINRNQIEIDAQTARQPARGISLFEDEGNPSGRGVNPFRQNEEGDQLYGQIRLP